MKHVSVRIALLENSVTAELAFAVAMFTAARATRLVASYAELPTKFRDGRTVSVHNSPLAGSFTPPPSRIVVRLPIVRDPARLCRIKRAYLARHYRGVERVPSSSSSRGSGRRGSARRGRCLPTSWRLPLSPTRSARSSGSRAAWPPLVGTDSVGDSLVTEGFAVSVPAAWAERLVAMAQPRFLEQGFYLFRAEQHFGIGRRSDRVALFPRSDRYEILRLVGTNGWNYDIGPDSIVAWLRVLERDHPFVLTGMGFDWTVDALAQELGESQRLYCWWD